MSVGKLCFEYGAELVRKWDGSRWVGVEVDQDTGIDVTKQAIEGIGDWVGDKEKSETK